MTYFSDSTWAKFAVNQGLDARLSKAIPNLKIEHPTTVQEKACPAILSGKDVLIKSPTGTGKSLAYIIPMIQRLISREENIKPMSLVILVPTKDLCGQVFGVCSSLLHYLFDVVSVDCFTGEGKYKRPAIPSIFITTPRGLLSLNDSRKGVCDSIKYIVVDEADLVLSHGFEKDIQAIISEILPREYQAVLVSATLSDDLETLKGLMLRNPLSVLINEISTVAKTNSGKGANSGIREYYLPCTSRDKFLCLYTMVKLEIISGKILVFTSSIDSAYRLKLFFDRFAIRSGVLNSEMPIECRSRVLSAYKDSLFPILIAEQSGGADPETAAHRGIDFSNVAAVVNFDLPNSVQSYIHRAGRTARGGKSGMVLSFFDMQNSVHCDLFNELGAHGRTLENIEIPVAAFEPLRYRCEDVYKGISRRAITATRQKELLSEIMHNDQLKQKLSENSEDIQALRQAMRTLREHSKVKWHLAEIPEYLLPDLKALKSSPVCEQVTKFIRKQARTESTKPKGKARLRDKMLRRDPAVNDESAAPDELAPISGRKLWKVRHHKRISRKGDNMGKPPRVARRLWKSAKKFNANGDRY